VASVQQHGKNKFYFLSAESQHMAYLLFRFRWSFGFSPEVWGCKWAFVCEPFPCVSPVKGVETSFPCKQNAN